MRAGLTRSEFIRLLKQRIRFKAFQNHDVLVIGITKDNRHFCICDGYFDKKGTFILVNNPNPQWWRCERFIIDSNAKR